MRELLTPIKFFPRGIRIEGETYYETLSLAERFTDELQMEPVIVRISEDFNNNGLALPLSNTVVLGEKYTPNAPPDVSEVSVGFILGHEIGHIYDYRGIERGFVHRAFLLFPFLLYEYLKNQFGGWIGNAIYRAIMWLLSLLLYIFVKTTLYPALIDLLGIPAAAPELQVMLITALLWNNYFLGIKLRSEIFANAVAKRLLWNCFSIEQGRLLMFEETFYLAEMITLNLIFAVSLFLPTVAALLFQFFGSVFGFLAAVATINAIIVGLIFRRRYRALLSEFASY